MIKTNLSYLKDKSFQKGKTLQNDYKYQRQRVNQSQFDQNNKLKRKYDTSSLNMDKTWTDNKIQEIKRKYMGQQNRHRRNHTYSQNLYSQPNFQQVQKSLGKLSQKNRLQQKQLSKVSQKTIQKAASRIPLRQRSFSNFQNNIQKKYNSNVNPNYYQNKTNQLDITSLFINKKSQENFNDSFVRKNQSKKYYYLEQSSFCVDGEIQKIKQNQYQPFINKLGSRLSLQRNRDNNSSIKKQNNRSEDITKYKSTSLDKHQSGKIELLKADFDPRIQNIDQINNRIKKALQDFSLNDVKIQSRFSNEIKYVQQSRNRKFNLPHKINVKNGQKTRLVESKNILVESKNIQSDSINALISPKSNLISPKHNPNSSRNLNLIASKNNLTNHKFQARKKWIQHQRSSPKLQSKYLNQYSKSPKKQDRKLTQKQINSQDNLVRQANKRNKQIQNLKFTFNKQEQINKIKQLNNKQQLNNNQLRSQNNEDLKTPKNSYCQRYKENKQNKCLIKSPNNYYSHSKTKSHNDMISYNHKVQNYQIVKSNFNKQNTHLSISGISRKQLLPQSQDNQQQTKSILLHSSSRVQQNITPQKLNKLKNIKTKYQNKVSYRSTITDYQVQSRIKQRKNQKQITTMNNIKLINSMDTSNLTQKYSPVKKRFDLTNIKQNKSEQVNQNKRGYIQINDQICQWKGQASQNKKQQIQFKDQASNSDQVNCLTQDNFDQLIKLTKSGIQTRKRIKQQPISKSKANNIFQFFQQLIAQQIQLDQNLRKAKFWYKFYKQQSKQLKLKSAIQQKSKQYSSLNQVSLNQFQMIEQQIDPFFSVRLTNYSCDELVNLYVQSDKNWRQNIFKIQTIQKLIQNDWIKMIDIDRKGYGLLSDLTRFMNFNSDSFYRNRDLALVFKRLTSSLNKQGTRNIFLNVKPQEKRKNYLNHRTYCIQYDKLTQKSLQHMLQFLY